MGLFDKLREPVVIKGDSDAQKQIEQLEFYSKIAPPYVKDKIEKDIKLISMGLTGENALMYELKNSHMPMYILHDIFFEENGLKTQIDYIVITRKVTFVIECKNLYGNITVDNNGAFTRIIGKHKEGMYSPITQNQRHLDMIKEKRRVTISPILRSGFDKNFDNAYKSLVVLSNPKTIINDKYAKKDVKEKIIRLDQLISKIKEINDNCNLYSLSDNEMKNLADFFLNENVPNTVDYTEKYGNIVSDCVSNLCENNELVFENTSNNDIVEAKSENSLKLDDIESIPVYKALKDYRYKQSQKEKIKPYFIYNNAQLEEIIRRNPKTLEELKQISGFGDAKCLKYGKDILLILGDFLK